MPINSRAKIGESGSANLTYYFSKCVLNRVIFLLINFLFGGAIASLGNPTLAEIIPDATLGAEPSVVTPLDDLGLPIDEIDGGARRDANLFHSFLEFNVEADRGAYFYSPAGIENILARVTGGNPSRILGLLGTFGDSTPNLFLINPQGIIFGPNARLDVGGSFVATTANSLVFNNGFAFSATDPQIPPLLSINVPIGLQFGRNPGRIVVKGDGQSLRTTPDLIDTTAGLRVQPNQTLALVGGDVVLEGGTLKTAGGRIELGSVASPSLVTLTSIDKGWALGYDGVSRFEDIQLSQQTAVDASGAGGGDVQLRGRRVTIQDGSQIEASTLGAETGGTLLVRVSDSVELSGTSANGQFSSGLFALVYPGATGAGGNLTVETRRFIVRDGAQVSAVTYGEGQGGNLTVTASEAVEAIGSEFLTGLFAQTWDIGAAGNLTIETGRLNVQNGAQLSATTASKGKGGTLQVNAREFVEVTGTSANGLLNSGLFAQSAGSGDAGSLRIATRRLIVRDGGQVLTATIGQGQGGTLEVNASESVLLAGTSPELPSRLSTASVGAGNAGNLRVATGQLIVRDGANVSTFTAGAGNAGTLSVRASNLVEVSGNSSLSTQVEQGATGTGGNFTIETGRLLVRDGAQIGTGSFGEGAAGDLVVNATEAVDLVGRTADDQFASGLYTQAQSTGAAGYLWIRTGQLTLRDGAEVSASTAGAGSAGNLIVETRRLIVRDGARLTAATVGEGQGGTLQVNASESVELVGKRTLADGRQFFSGLLTQTTGAGAAGALRIVTGQLTVRDGAQANVSSEGSGVAGNLEVKARSIQLENQAALTATTRAGNGGNITLHVQDLLLMRHGSRISTTAGKAQAGGDGGNITIDADFIVAVPKEDSDITANAFTGRGGNINITTQGIYGLEFRPDQTPLSDITASSEFGVNGTVQINTPDVDPSRGLANLPVEPVNVEVAQGCQGAGKQGAIEFFNTGRGGLASNPYEPLSSSNIWEDVPLGTQEAENSASASGTSVSTATPSGKLVEAQGWLVNEQGQVVLVAEVPTTRFQSRCRLR